jgi:predicted NUDIX family NTP pyrophosphohydrolase
MAKRSAGILLFRRRPSGVEVLLAHPGGPFWTKKDLGAWTIPKGEIEDDEDPLAAARRELKEETGISTDGPFLELGEVRLKSGKRVAAWGAEGDADPAVLESITFSMEWPPRSGKTAEFPEVDRWDWFGLGEAARRLNPAQAELLERLRARLD